MKNDFNNTKMDPQSYRETLRKSYNEKVKNMVN